MLISIISAGDIHFNSHISAFDSQGHIFNERETAIFSGLPYIKFGSSRHFVGGLAGLE
ncbi:MAG: hypothetical protein ACLQIQ_00720 [Beijerinckiaceae bacterium]